MFLNLFLRMDAFEKLFSCRKLAAPETHIESSQMKNVMSCALNSTDKKVLSLN